MSRKYVIVGAGATGGCIGGYLVASGQDVTLIARGKHLEAMRDNGFCIHTVRIGNHCMPVKMPGESLQKGEIRACSMAEYNDTPDVIFVCVKSYSLQEVFEFINRVGNENTLVIPILNVFGTGGEIQKVCPKVTVLDGCIYIFSMIEEPGVISQPTQIFRVIFGYRSEQERKLMKLAKQVESDLQDAAIDGLLTDSVVKEALRKFSFVSPMGAAGLYHHATGKDFLVPGPVQDTWFSLVREVVKLGHAMGIDYEEDLLKVNYQIMSDLTPDSITSMQRDVYNNRQSEIDGLIHRMVRLAKEYQVELPTYEMISKWAIDEQIS